MGEGARATSEVENVPRHLELDALRRAFGRVGRVARVSLPRDARRRPKGFCFVEYHNRKDAERAVKYLNGTKLDDREVRIDFDWGFQDGRQFGRGKSGGQVRDEYRTNYDAGRGGYGKLIKNELENLNEEGAAGANEGDGFRGGGDHGPSSAANAAAAGGGGGAAPKVGSKRGRDDDSDEEMEEEKGNPRFRGDDADSDED